MPRGPCGERRPEDPAAAAVMVVRLATGEASESLDDPETVAQALLNQPKNPAAMALGRLGGQKGGRARADKLSEGERIAIATRAANARWKNDG
jgi:hypothetical protein